MSSVYAGKNELRNFIINNKKNFKAVLQPSWSNLAGDDLNRVVRTFKKVENCIRIYNATLMNIDN